MEKGMGGCSAKGVVYWGWGVVWKYPERLGYGLGYILYRVCHYSNADKTSANPRNIFLSSLIFLQLNKLVSNSK